MAAPQNVELEAAKFLHKLIQESKDEPTKLATKLHVILQHMRSSGKENSMPYQVISRAMETVINQHGLDIEALKSSRLPSAGGTRTGDSSSTQFAGSSQTAPLARDSKAGIAENEVVNSHASSRPPVGPSCAGHDIYQGSVSHIRTNSFDHESPSSFETRSANSQSQERHDTANWEKANRNDSKKVSSKRKRADSTSTTEPYIDSPQQLDTSNHTARKGKLVNKVEPPGSLSVKASEHSQFNMVQGSGASGKVHGAARGISGSYPQVEPGILSPIHFSSAAYDNHGELGSSTLFTGKALEHDGGISNALANANKIFQSGIQGNITEMNMLRGAALRDTGKSPIFQAPGVSNMPFKEQHLKQLRAQCLVFLAFRNGLMPKKLHLEIALGNFLPKEDGAHNELIDHKGKELSINDPSNIPEDTMLFGRLHNVRETEIVPQGPSTTGIVPKANLSKESEDPNMMVDKNILPTNLSIHAEERRHLLATRRKGEAEKLNQEMSESQAFLTKGSQPVSLSVRGLAVSNHRDDLENGQEAGIANQASSFMRISKQMKPEMIISGMEAEHQTVMPVKDANVLMKNVPDDDQKISEIQRRCIPDGCETVPFDDMQKNGSHSTVVETDQVEEDISLCTDLRPSPKYTTSEKWIMEHQKRKLLIEQNWALKQKKTEQRIAACSDKLKETVSSSEDISAKTKSVIELKKLQLLELQRRLRSDVLNDFFKPIATEMDRLKSIKKHRIGRRSKQIERFEQRMKEERQKRIRERQKEFFSEIEVHKERLDDVFKMKRERWKGFNKYVREFHKRKERIHREKIDKIQREKINLLKINDVEGYLRMVQDAKSDRVKQLLKETEKYLQKLGSKLRDAKAMERNFETDTDENRIASVVENNEMFVENEDEADQAKHYMESNEKYYLMAHSIKESITEQPTSLVGGKLREYQKNGLRWLVSLYNNHLNGILADEMGLGKTVQVIALICYLMETKNDRGPFLVVVPSSVLPGWESEINFWAPGVNKIVYSGPPEERRRLFKERIVQQKFNVLLTTYEYLMNKHDRPKLSKLHWHYIIIDEGHRIKNASCKLNADLKHYRSSHRLLLTGTPLQNNLEELWALLNFLLPNIFNSSEDFSQWFNKPFESNGDNSPDEALLSEEENLLIINRLHQVLRPFVLRRLKHKVENELPEKIERLIRCEASAYQKLLMKRVEDNLGAIGTSKGRTVHNSVMELRNICNHPYLSQLHVEEVHDLVPKHYLPNIVRLCGKLEMLDRLLPKLKATDHRVLFFSTMTRLLDVMEDYLCWKQYRYLRLDGHTSGGDRGALIDRFNQSGSPFFIFLLSIRAGGVGVNLQAADTVILFDTDWNPQVDLQAQARAHRIGQKKDVLVLRLETVQTVEEQVRASAEHKLGVANQSITAGFFDNNTSAEDRREYLESLLRECKKEEAAPVLGDDALNDLIARSESEIDIFESVDRQRLEEETAIWKTLVLGQGKDGSEPITSLPSRLLTDDDLKPFYEAMKISEVSNASVTSNVGAKRKSGSLGLDTQHYGRGKRAREVRSYEEQWSEEEFEKMCQVDSPESPKLKEEMMEKNSPIVASGFITVTAKTEPPAPLTVSPQPSMEPPQPSVEPPMQPSKEVAPPSRRGRGRPKRATTEISPSAVVHPAPSGASKTDMASHRGTVSSFPGASGSYSLPSSATVTAVTGTIHQFGVWIAPNTQSNPPLPPVSPVAQSTPTSSPSVAIQVKGQTRKTQGGVEPPRRRGKKQAPAPPAVPVLPAPSGTGKTNIISQIETVSSFPTASCPDSVSGSANVKGISTEQGPVSPAVPVLPASSETGKMDLRSEVQPVSSNPMVPGPDSFLATPIVTGISRTVNHVGVAIVPSSQPIPPLTSDALGCQLIPPSVYVPKQRGRKPQSGVGAPQRRGKKQGPVPPVAADGLSSQHPKSNEQPQSKVQGRKSIGTRRKIEDEATELMNIVQGQAFEVQTSDSLAGPDSKPTGQLDYLAQNKQQSGLSKTIDSAAKSSDKIDNQTEKVDAKAEEMRGPVLEEAVVSVSEVAGTKSLEEGKKISPLETAAAVVDPVIQKTEKEVDTEAQESDDPILQEAVVSKPEVCELESKLGAGPFESVEDSRDLDEENLIIRTYVEGTSSVPLNADPLNDVPCEKPPAPDALVSDLTMDKCQDQSGEKDAKEQEMKGPILENAVVSEPKEIKGLTLEKAAPVDSEMDKIEKEVAEAAQESNIPILQEAVVSEPEGYEAETKLNGGSSENVADRRDLVKEHSIVGTNVEGISAVPLNAGPLDGLLYEKPPAPDASVWERDTKLDAGSFENLANPRDLAEENLIVGTIVEGTSPVPLDVDSSDVLPCEKPPASDVSVLDLTVDKHEDHGKEDAKQQKMRGHLLDEAVVPELGVAEAKSLEEKKFSTLSTLEKVGPVFYPEINAMGDVSRPEPCDLEAKLEAGSLENVADPKDLAKENSMAGTNVESTSAVPVSSDPSENLPCKKSPHTPNASVAEKETTILDLRMDKCKDQFGKENSKEQERTDTVLDEGLVSEPVVTENQSLEERTSSTLETASPIVNPPHGKPEIHLNAGSSENVGDSKHLVEENLIMGTNMEVTPAVHLNSIPSNDVPHEKPHTSDASLDGSLLGGSSIPMDSPLASEGAKESTPPE